MCINSDDRPSYVYVSSYVEAVKYSQQQGLRFTLKIDMITPVFRN